MATAGRTKINTNIEKGHFGPVPGIEVGQSWQYRIQLSENGVHAPPGEIFSPIRYCINRLFYLLFKEIFCTMGYINFCSKASVQKFLCLIVQKNFCEK